MKLNINIFRNHSMYLLFVLLAIYYSIPSHAQNLPVRIVSDSNRVGRTSTNESFNERIQTEMTWGYRPSNIFETPFIMTKRIQGNIAEKAAKIFSGGFDDSPLYQVPKIYIPNIRPQYLWGSNFFSLEYAKRRGWYRDDIASMNLKRCIP